MSLVKDATDTSQRRKNRCGVDDFLCGTCPKCRGKEEKRWDEIWKEKYADQEKRYYKKDIISHLIEHSGARSSLVTNAPIDSEDFLILSPDKAALSRLRAAGRRRRRIMRRGLLSRVLPESFAG